jgi:hypothetical protein
MLQHASNIALEYAKIETALSLNFSIVNLVANKEEKQQRQKALDNKTIQVISSLEDNLALLGEFDDSVSEIRQTTTQLSSPIITPSIPTMTPHQSISNTHVPLFQPLSEAMVLSEEEEGAKSSQITKLRE